MSEFGAAGNLALTIEDSELRQARRKIERELGDLTVDVTASASGPQSGAAGMLSDGGVDLGRELSEQTELLDEIREILDDMGSMGGIGGGPGSGPGKGPSIIPAFKPPKLPGLPGFPSLPGGPMLPTGIGFPALTNFIPDTVESFGGDLEKGLEDLIGSVPSGNGAGGGMMSLFQFMDTAGASSTTESTGDLGAFAPSTTRAIMRDVPGPDAPSTTRAKMRSKRIQSQTGSQEPVNPNGSQAPKATKNEFVFNMTIEGRTSEQIQRELEQAMRKAKRDVLEKIRQDSNTATGAGSNLRVQ